MKRILCSFLLIILSKGAWAACTLESTSNVTISIPAVIVQRDTPVGTTIWQGSVGQTTGYIGCSNSGWTEQRSNLVGWDTGLTTGNGNYKIYSTNLSGVGYAIAYNNSGFNVGSWPGPGTQEPVTGGLTLAGTTMYLRLVKISAIQSGNLIISQYGKWTITGLGTYMNLYIGGVASVTQVACSISTPNLTFPIGNVLASSFGSTIGTVPSGAQNTQNLGLNCDAGANINVMLQGSQNPDVGTTSVLALTGQGNSDVAKGVGVQILYNGSPQNLNNRIVLKRSSGGQESFPITARYYQTKTAVTTGKANASATLDLTYQ
ncbi:fimbrial protein [Enterobacter mori]|uniref:fimbrial protein n=1 Tax=Enterobacter mori TaxID=539813 RepID=UPI0026E27086|nr:fimbrial protein [Enterobacter mori]WKW39616.1 fimbrial protein [Enterobacter mori]